MSESTLRYINCNKKGLQDTCEGVCECDKTQFSACGRGVEGEDEHEQVIQSREQKASVMDRETVRLIDVPRLRPQMPFFIATVAWLDKHYRTSKNPVNKKIS